jgi:glutamate/aspartate transport system substrate-binding protein
MRIDHQQPRASEAGELLADALRLGHQAAGQRTARRSRSFRDLAGRKVAVTAGTTNEKTMRELAAKFKVDMTLQVAPDHAASFALLASGAVDAFATDDVLLYGLLAQNRAQGEYAVIGDFLSYDPYGLMFRRGDAPLAALVDATFRSLAEDGEIGRRYQRWFLQKLPSGQSLNLR